MTAAEIRDHISSNRNNGYYGSDWTDDAIIDNLINNNFASAEDARSYRTAPNFTDMIADVFNSPASVNPGSTAPVSAFDRQLPADNAVDNSGLFSQISGLFTSLLGTMGRPNSTVTVSPVTTTREDVRVDNSTTYTDNSVNQSGFSLDALTGFMARIPSLLSIPNGNDILSPAAPPYGFAPNPSQSGPRISSQAVATLGGFGLDAGGVTVGGASLKWGPLIIGALLSLGLFIVYRKFFK